MGMYLGGGVAGFFVGGVVGSGIATAVFQCTTIFLIIPAGSNCFTTGGAVVGISLASAAGGAVLGAIGAGALWRVSHPVPVALLPVAQPGKLGLVLSGEF